MKRSLLVIQGDDTFLRRRAVTKQTKALRDLVILDAETPGFREQLDTTCSQTMFTGNPVFIHVRGVKEVSPLYEDVPEDVNLLLEIEGRPKSNTKLAKWLEKLPKNTVLDYSLPEKSWDLGPRAESFLKQELTGLTISDEIITAIVTKVGTDLGVLSFEALKIRALMLSYGETTVSVRHLKGVLVGMLEASIEPIVNAVGAKDRAALVRALRRVYEGAPADPTIGICYFMFKSALKWLKVLQVRNEPEDVAAQKTGLHPWIYRTKVAPQARLLGKKRVRAILTVLAQTERKVKSGEISPQVFMETGLLEALSDPDESNDVG